jgi:ketosteroid isomerase-like protein
MMLYKSVIRTGLVLGILSVSSLALGQDLAALKAGFAAEIEALDTKNLEATVDGAHDDIVLFGVFSPFPIVGKEEFQRTVQEYFSQHEQATFTPFDAEFGVIGETGVAWGDYRMAIIPNGGSLSHSEGRYIFTYAKAGGEWKLLSMHISPLPE